MRTLKVEPYRTMQSPRSKVVLYNVESTETECKTFK